MNQNQKTGNQKSEETAAVLETAAEATEAETAVLAAADKLAAEMAEADRVKALEAHAEIVKVAAETLAQNDKQRAIPTVDLDVRKQFPQLAAAHNGIAAAVKAAPAWKGPGWREGDKLHRIPAATTVLKGTREAPATIERREFTLIRLGMPTTARVEFLAALERLHDAWCAAGLNLGKENAEDIIFD